ncbi:MAG: hypothetical protein SXA11_15530 [Cyanobacteriota bacterium]|nr:hypothetical protein [Cyanobacteriota bacterium]
MKMINITIDRESKINPFVQKDSGQLRRKFDLSNLNNTFSPSITKELNNPFEEHKLDTRKKQKTKFSKDEIDKLSTFEEILQYGIESIKLKDYYFFKRIRELEELCAEEEDVEISLESLKSMFLFVGTIGNISKPSSLTVNDNGFFHLGWKKDKNNSITLEFKKDYFSNYVIFKPSRHISKRIILNGSMYVLDLIDYLHNLKIKIHRYA